MTDQPTPAPHWTARYGKPIIFVILTMVAVGIYLAASIPVAVFPSTNFPRIVVGADVGVYPIDQMLVTVTRPLEEALNTVPGLDRVTSITSRGSAEINLFFDWNVDMDLTLQLVNAAVARVQSTLPPNARVTANRLTFAAFPILGYSLTSDRVPQTALWELATYTLKPRLNRAAGVSSVVVQGGQVPEFHIQPDPARLIETGVTIPNILDAITRSNMIDSPGLIEANHQLVLTLMSGQARSLDDIGNIVVRTTPNGSVVHVRDIASVNNAVMPVYTVVTANGKPAVLLNVYRQPASNTVDVAEAVHRQIAELRKDLPPGVEIQPFYDQSELVVESIRSVRDAILLGLILASLIMVLFLRDWGTSLVAGLVIPATIGVTFIAMRLLGQSFNLMTLGGLAAAVGLVIDDAIVVVENIVLHRDSGQSRAEAIRNAIREIRVPLAGSTITPHRRVPAADLHHRRHRRVLPRAGHHRGRGAAHVTGAGAHLDTGAQSQLAAQPAHGRRQPQRVRPGLADASLRTDAALHPGASAGAGALYAAAGWADPMSATATPARTCCRRWTKAASSSTTSCRPAPRCARPTA